MIREAITSAVAVWRNGFEVFHGPLPLDEAAALEAAASGASLAAICAAFAYRQDPAAAAHAALSSWLREGWIAALSSAVRLGPGTDSRPPSLALL